MASDSLFFYVVGVMFQWRIWLLKRGGKPSFSVSVFSEQGELILKISQSFNEKPKKHTPSNFKEKKSKNLSSHNVEGDWRKKIK
jgi:hypothetical protein